MKFLVIVRLTSICYLLLFSMQLAAGPGEASVLTEALNLMSEARDVHKNNRLVMGREIDTTFGKNLDKLVERGVIEKVSATFMGDRSVAAYRIGDSMEVWIRKRTRGTGTSLDAVYWEFERNKSGALTGIKGKGVDTYTVFNKNYPDPIFIDSRNELSLNPSVFSKNDLKVSKQLGLDSSQMRKKMSHFGSKISTAQHWVNDISVRLKKIDQAGIDKLNIPGSKIMVPADFKNVHVRLTMDQKESFLWVDRAKNHDVYNRLRKLDASRGKLNAELNLRRAQDALRRAQGASGSDSASQIARAKTDLEKAREKLKRAEDYVKEVDEDIAKAKKNSSLNNSRKPATPARIPNNHRTTKVMNRIATGLKGAGYSATVIGAVLVADDVLGKSREFKQVYIQRGLGRLFEQGRFIDARRFWNQEVVNMENAPATELFTSITSISGIYAASYAVAWENSMTLMYEDLEAPARKLFSEYVEKIKNNPAEFSKLALDTKLVMEVMDIPEEKVLAGDPVSVTLQIYIEHDLGDWGEYKQVVQGVPVVIMWNGHPMERRSIKTNKNGMLREEGFGTGELVRDTSLGEQYDRSKMQYASHFMILSVPEWEKTGVVSKLTKQHFSVQAYDYIVERIPQEGNRDVAHANSRDSIYFKFKLQKRSLSASGALVYDLPMNYRQDFSQIGISSGKQGSGPMSVSLSEMSYKADIQAEPPENTGVFNVFAISDTAGPNEIRLHLRGGKFHRQYLELGKYPVEFKHHPVAYNLRWGAKMTEYLQGGVVKIPPQAYDSTEGFDVQVFAFSTEDNTAKNNVRLRFQMEPEDGASILRGIASTNKKGEALDGVSLPKIWKVRAGETKIIISAEGSENFLQLIVRGTEKAIEVPDNSGSGATLIANGSFESGVDPGTFATLSNGSKGIKFWRVSGESIDYIGSYFSASEGNRSIDLNGTPGAGGVEQVFKSRSDQEYELVFDMGGNVQCEATEKYLSVAAAGESKTFSHADGFTWAEKRWRFTAKSNETRLAFVSKSTAGRYCGALLDNVRLSLAKPPMEEEPSAGNGMLNTDKKVYASGQAVKVSYSDVPGNQSDWITVVKITTPDSQWEEWYYLSGATEGEQDFTNMLEPGVYEARLYFNWSTGGYVVHARSQFRVVDSMESD